MKKHLRFLAVFCTLLIASSTVAFAHPGRTDAYGGHHDYNNVSGLGSYHYHHGYSAHLHPNGICPYNKSAATTTKPKTTTTVPKTTTTPKTTTAPKTTTTPKTTTKPKTTTTVPKTTTTPKAPVTPVNPVIVSPQVDHTSKVIVNGTPLTGQLLSFNNDIYVPLYPVANALSATVNEDASTKTYTMTYNVKSWYMDEFVVFVPMVTSDHYYHKMECPVINQNGGLSWYLSMDIGFAELGLIDSVSPCPYCIH